MSKSKSPTCALDIHIAESDHGLRVVRSAVRGRPSARAWPIELPRGRVLESHVRVRSAHARARKRTGIGCQSPPSSQPPPTLCGAVDTVFDAQDILKSLQYLDDKGSFSDAENAVLGGLFSLQPDAAAQAALQLE